jgi:hypothetical protein
VAHVALGQEAGRKGFEGAPRRFRIVREAAARAASLNTGLALRFRREASTR